MNPAFSRRTGLRALAAAVVTGTVATTAPAALAKTAQHAPELQPLLAYTQKELTQTLTGLPQGPWLLGAENWKHRVPLAGLKPGKEYTYTVTQGGQRHTASFRTADDGRDWSDLRLIAFSATETEPYGRIENREWELSQVTPYTEGSLPRPGEGSLWQQTFGSTVRYGAFTLKYPLTQDVGLRENIARIDAAGPGPLFLDCSTISTSEAQEVAALAEAAGHRAADAPVSGGVVGAEMGRLAQRTYAAYADGEGARRDFSGIIETVREAGKDTAA